MRSSLANAAAVIGILFPTLAVAQSSSPPPSTSSSPTATTPRELLRRGFELRNAGHDAEALTLFREAFSLSNEPRTLAQIALAEQALGRWVEAERDLQHALESSTSDRWIRSNTNALREALAEIERHLGALDLTGGVDGAHVFVDDVEIGVLPLTQPIRVRLGPVDVRIEASGYEPWHRTVDASGPLTREPVTLRALVVASSAPPPVASESPSESPPGHEEARSMEIEPDRRRDTSVGERIGAAPVVLAAGGLAFLAIGTIFYALRTSEQSQLTRQCDPFDDPSTSTIECPRDLGPEAIYARMELYNGLSIGGVALGSALVAGGVAWAIARIVAPSARVQTSRLRLAPVVGHAQLGAVVEVRF